MSRGHICCIPWVTLLITEAHLYTDTFILLVMYRRLHAMIAVIIRVASGIFHRGL